MRMTLHSVAMRTLQILLVGALIAALGWLNRQDQDVAQAAAQQYCADVATWQAEAEQGIAPTRRTGHPDYRDIAAEQCVGAGLRPAAPALDNQPQRQLVRN